MKMTEEEIQTAARVIVGMREETPQQEQDRLMNAKMEKSRELEDRLDDIAREGEYKL